MSDTQFDIIIIGAGPGGYVAAIRSAQLGMNTAVVEEKHLGGICLNWGCIPTKALLRSAEIYHYMQNAGDYGLSADTVGYDVAAVVKRSRTVSGRLNKGVGHLLKKNKVTVIDGRGRLDGAGKVIVTGQDGASSGYTAPHVIVATGARPRQLPGFKSDGKHIWTYFEAMIPETMPKSLLVVGSGAIGIEFASFYRSMDVEVTVVEILDRILPSEDVEIASVARKLLEKRGVKIMTGAKLEKLDKTSSGITATVKDSKGVHKIIAEKAISAVGVVGNIEDVGLETTDVKTERGIILTEGPGRTDQPGVYAIGDVAGPPMLAHKAEHEGVICVEAIAGLEPHPLDKTMIPACVYCSPQVASVGLNEEQAEARGHKLRVGRFPFIGNGKAIALGEPKGLVKTVFDAETGQLLGAQMVGAEVTELIQGYLIAMTLEASEQELMRTVFPHPTLSEAMHESVLDAYGRAIHI
ncbi:MAG: dihydrolipoyl dehydrogenase [Hyphomicrobiales bacterium]